MDSETTKNRRMCFSQKKKQIDANTMLLFFYFFMYVSVNRAVWARYHTSCAIWGKRGRGSAAAGGGGGGGGGENSYMNHAFSRGCLMHFHNVLYQASISATNYGSIENQLAQSTRKIIKKVSIHVSLRSPRRLTWADTFCKCRRPPFS